jgi:hypothetical protein
MGRRTRTRRDPPHHLLATHLVEPRKKAKLDMQTQTILRTDGMIEHTAPFRWFPCIQRWWNLRQVGPGARTVKPNELNDLRATPISERK